MAKTLHNLSKLLLLTACFAMPTAMMANTKAETEEAFYSQVEVEVNKVEISISGSTLQVKNAEGQAVEIFNLIGEKVYTQSIDSSSKSINLSNLQRGYYIVRVGKFSRKVYLH